VLLLYGALYPVLRFVIEIFRGDFTRLYVAEWHTPRLAGWLGVPPGEPLFLSFGQVMSVVLVASAAVAFVYRRRAWTAANAGSKPGTQEI
jgi:prolipoprotein diacylglyceryltransferase